jgi:hypothetical protein
MILFAAIYNNQTLQFQRVPCFGWVQVKAIENQSKLDSGIPSSIKCGLQDEPEVYVCLVEVQ